MSEDENEIRRQLSLPGIPLHLHDVMQVSTVRVHITKVVEKMYKKHGITYIGIKEGAESGEVIQTGNLGLKYRIIGLTKKVLPIGGYRYRIKRIDGANITQLDIDAVSVGDKVKFKSRRTFIELMNYPDQGIPPC